MKKALIFFVLLMGCQSSKTKSAFILKINTKTEKTKMTNGIRVDTIYAKSDTAAFSEATKRTMKHFMFQLHKNEKDSSSYVMHYSFTVTDSKGNSLVKTLPKKYLDSIGKVMRTSFNSH